jgi:hypothetical protein
MPNANDPKYHAQYQRALRARAREAGCIQLNSLVPGELVALLDAVKQARGLSNRNQALAEILREYFAHGNDERTPAVSP